jgi:hypothetical protein
LNLRDDKPKLLQDAAPEVSRLYLEDYLESKRGVLSNIELAIKAMHAIENAKRPRAKKHRLALRAIGWFLSEISDQEPQKKLVSDWYFKKWLIEKQKVD